MKFFFLISHILYLISLHNLFWNNVYLMPVMMCILNFLYVNFIKSVKNNKELNLLVDICT
jgi:hypothetical protein